MTEEQRRAIRMALAENTRAATVSKEAARDFLVKNGYHTKSGDLTAAYGGDKRKAG